MCNFLDCSHVVCLYELVCKAMRLAFSRGKSWITEIDSPVTLLFIKDDL